MSQFDLYDLYYFVQVVDHSGFASAGRALGMPKSKLSRRVALLEERLGVRLLLRSTRKFAVTEVGQTYYQHCKAMLVEAEAAQLSIDAVQAQPRGVVRISCPITLLHELVGKMLTDFMVMHPDVTVQLEATNRKVDVIGEGLDLAIRVRTLPLDDSELSVRMLAEHAQILVASPILMARLGLPSSPHDLANWPSLWLGSPEQQFVWRLEHADQGPEHIAHTPRLVTTDMVALRGAALAGLGVVQLPSMFARAELDSGALVQVLPGWEPRAELIHAVYASRRGQLPAVRALLDHLAQEFGAMNEE